MQITRSKIQYLPTTVFIVVVVLISALSCGDVVTADMYTDSAHGNTDPEPGYGVNRSGIDHPIGDCTHCHDTFDPSICGQYNFMLFFDAISSPCVVGCMSCHSYFATWQPTVNYPYAKNFGGASPIWYGDIYTQFCSANSLPANCGSRHHLGRIWLVIKDNARDWGFNSDPHPCVACHPPHHAQQNHPVAIDGEGKLNTAIRRPSHYKSTEPENFLWGDDDDERMNDYAASVGGTYQAPYYTTGTKFEPSGNASPSDGSDLPDYVTFCMDCHQYAQYDPDTNEGVKAIVWDYSHGLYPDIHGAAPANTRDAWGIGCWTTEGFLKAPYDTYEPDQSNYVLSCLDCHEPHGTYKRMHLIRLRINGETVAVDYPVEGHCDQVEDWTSLCEKCHELTHGMSCQGCHGTSDGFHGTVFECSYGVGDCVPGNPNTCPRSF